jgi:hypothetical protein
MTPALATTIGPTDDQLASALPPMHLPIKLLTQMVIQTAMGICKGQALLLVRWLALADLKASPVTGLKALFLAGTPQLGLSFDAIDAVSMHDKCNAKLVPRLSLTALPLYC